MRKILTIISIVILFILSGFIFWMGLAPDSFFKFFIVYPVVQKTINEIGIVNNQDLKLLTATSSEPVSSYYGQVTVNNNTWSVEITRTEQDRINGLSNRKTLYGKRGMLFAFDKSGPQSFWMKDMLISIDMIFFDDNWQIVEIDSNLSPNSFPQTFGTKIKSKYVLEINAGEADSYGLKVGDRAFFVNK